MSVFSILSEEFYVYAQDDELFSMWDSESVCEQVEDILSAKDKNYEQLSWISKDAVERDRFVSSFTSDEINTILSCAQSNLSNLESKIITKKIGFFEGKNNHNANGESRLISIENQDYLRFENFEIGFFGDTNPDLHVYLTKSDDFSDTIYLENLKTKVGSKNYPLRDVDVDTYDTVIIYDEITKEIFATVHLTNTSFLIDGIMGIFNNFKNDVNHPKIESDIIYTKAGILDGSNGFESVGRVTTSFEEDDAELKFENFKISEGHDFRLYATENGNVKAWGLDIRTEQLSLC